MKSEKKNQSGFKKGQHTQTALLRVYNDFLFIPDVGDSAILILIDLSAAFGTFFLVWTKLQPYSHSPSLISLLFS